MKKYTIVLILIALTLFFTKLTFAAADKIERKFDVRDFTEIYLKGPYEVHLRQSSECGLRIIAEQDYFDRLEVASSMGKLSIELEGKNFKNRKSIEVYIHFKDLQKLQIVGAVDLNCENTIQATNMKLDFEGAGNVELNITASKIISVISGVGNFEIEGETDYHKVEFSGIGKYDARNLLSKYTIVESNGIGSVSVFASEKFKGDANGIGSVNYYGDPDDVSINASGLGSVNRQ
jgi:hypothetical protein